MTHLDVAVRACKPRPAIALVGTVEVLAEGLVLTQSRLALVHVPLASGTGPAFLALTLHTPWHFSTRGPTMARVARATGFTAVPQTLALVAVDTIEAAQIVGARSGTLVHVGLAEGSCESRIAHALKSRGQGQAGGIVEAGRGGAGVPLTVPTREGGRALARVAPQGVLAGASVEAGCGRAVVHVCFAACS